VVGMDVIKLTGRDVQRHPMITSILDLYQ
jgi:hypothetical protein